MTPKPLNPTNSQELQLQGVQNSHGSYRWGPLFSGKKNSGSFSCFYQEFGHYQTRLVLLLEALEKKERQTELHFNIILHSRVWTAPGRKYVCPDLRSDCCFLWHLPELLEVLSSSASSASSRSESTAPESWEMLIAVICWATGLGELGLTRSTKGWLDFWQKNIWHNSFPTFFSSLT